MGGMDGWRSGFVLNVRRRFTVKRSGREYRVVVYHLWQHLAYFLQSSLDTTILPRHVGRSR